MSVGAQAGIERERLVDLSLFTEDLGSLEGGRCRQCGAQMFPRRSICPDCQSEQVCPFSLSTQGVVWTFTVVRYPPPGYDGRVPYVLGIVELPEGLRVTSLIAYQDPAAVEIGDTVEFSLVRLGKAPDAPVTFAFAEVEETSA
jgi:hypothetical protein